MRVAKRPALATGKTRASISKRPAQAKGTKCSSIAKRPAQAKAKAHGRVAKRDLQAKGKKHVAKGVEQGLLADDLRSIVQALGPAVALGNMRLPDLKGHCKNLGLKPADTKLKIIKQIVADLSSSATPKTPRKRGRVASPVSAPPEEARKRARAASPAAPATAPPDEAKGKKHIRVASPAAQDSPDQRPQPETALVAWRKAVAVMTPEAALAAWRKAVVQEDKNLTPLSTQSG